jgi:ATP-binding cassette subfamily B multidrug efflux pump
MTRGEGLFLAAEFRRWSGFYRPYLRWLYLSMGLLVVTTVLGLVYPYLLKLIVNRVIIGHNYAELPWLVAAILAAALVKGVFNFGQQYTGQLFGSHTVYDLRNALYRKLNHQPFSYYDFVHTGDLMSRLTADLDAFRMFLAFGINNLVNLGLIVVFGMALMWWMNGWLALVILCLMPILAYVGTRFDRHLHGAFRRIRQSLGTLNSGVQETIMGIRTVKSFAKEDFEIDKFTRRNDDYFTSNMGASNIWKWFFPFIGITGNLGIVLILLIGGYLVMHRQMELGDLVAFLSVLWYILWPLSELGFYLNNWTQARAAGGRLLEILEAPDTLGIQGTPRVVQMRGHVRFDHVSVRYGDNLVLEDVDFEVNPGQTVALLGLTGAGKSTLVNLLPRFYDVSSGRVLIDGVDVREWDLQALRRQVAVVFQEPFLFSTTIFSNIAYGRPDATMAEVERAARLADAAEFIERLPDGYATIVGERGMGLSGGQKQRLALARAILMDPAILVLDDATSAVDMETEYQIQQALQEVMRDRTTFIIAHRISTLKRAHQILVLQHGRIVERGTHQELLASGGFYRRIFDMQFREYDTTLAAVANGSRAGGGEPYRG